MQDATRKFEDLGIDAMTGVQLMDKLDINPDELGDPIRFSRFQEVIKFFKEYPPETQELLINRAIVGKNVDKLKHIYEYMWLLKNKNMEEKMLEDLEKEKSAIETLGDEFALQDVLNRTKELELKHKTTLEDIALYTR